MNVTNRTQSEPRVIQIDLTRDEELQATTTVSDVLQTTGGGITNSGNSCYMAASLQAILRVPQVAALVWNKAPATDCAIFLNRALSNCFSGNGQSASLSASQTEKLRTYFRARGFKSNEAPDSEQDALNFVEFLLKNLGLPPFAVSKKDRVLAKPATSLALMHRLSISQSACDMQELVSEYTFDLEKLPTVLPIVLDGRTAINQEKNRVRIIPSELLRVKLAQVTDVQACYQLTSVIVYTGNKPTGGHYFCYVRKGLGWAEYNDSRVATHGESNKVTRTIQSDGYIHIYSKVAG